MTRIRRNVWNLPPGDQTLLWYGRAIGEMRNRPITDPTSWRFQAAIHEYNQSADPLAIPGEALPPPGVQARFWSQCQHGSWFFLPWHRMYLHFFEQIVAAEVVKLGGPSDWALPYWNYSGDEQSRLLPEAFRNPTLPDGTPNHLFVAERDPACNAGNQFADAVDVDLRPALTTPIYSSCNDVSFGGFPTDFTHSGRSHGQLEIRPHGSMHVAVGGNAGWMGGFNTAGLDPIFWLHHANIDRLWEVWLNRDPSHRNTACLQWRSRIPFSFLNAAGQAVVMRSLDVIETSALDYTYDDVSDPLAAPELAEAVVPRRRMTEVTMSDSIPPELVGATESSVQVGNTPSRIRIPTPAHDTARRRLAASVAEVSGAESVSLEAATRPRVFLQLENLTAGARANSYDVYVNIPEGEEPSEHPERFVGRLDLFGVAEASRVTAQHPGSGLTYTLDISGIYNQLSTSADWDPENIDVTLVPVRRWEGAPVTVGRVSLIFG